MAAPNDVCIFCGDSLHSDHAAGVRVGYLWCLGCIEHDPFGANVLRRIEEAWDARAIGKMNWLGMETTLRSILLEAARFDARVIVRLVDETVAAYTRRGHALPSDLKGAW